MRSVSSVATLMALVIVGISGAGSAANALVKIPEPFCQPKPDCLTKARWGLEWSLTDSGGLLVGVSADQAIPALSNEIVSTSLTGRLSTIWNLTELSTGRLDAASLGDPTLRVGLNSTLNSPYDSQYWKLNGGTFIEQRLSEYSRPEAGFYANLSVLPTGSSKLVLSLTASYGGTLASGADWTGRTDVATTFFGICHRFGPDSDPYAPAPARDCWFDSYIIDIKAAGVPEPANWSMMILGFAAVGVALRQRAPLGRRVAG